MPTKRKTTKRRFFPKSRKTVTKRVSSTGNMGGRKPASCILCIQKKTFCTKTLACER